MEYIEYINDLKIQLKEPFDLKFINQFGKLFWVLDIQSSGNLCFGVENGNKKYFIKFAGAKTINDHDLPPEDAIDRLKIAGQKYKEIDHPILTRLVDSIEIGNGYALVFDWVEGEKIGDNDFYISDKFYSIPIIKRINVFEEILHFHAHAAKCGYVAIDFNCNNVLYDYDTEKVKICDIDFYAKQSYMNGMGSIFGVKTLMSPEEYRCAGVIDEITNVYTMGATAFLLLSFGKRSFEEWTLNEKLFYVIKKAVNDARKERQNSIGQLIDEWYDAKRSM
jgi:serine/threonine-protein kinase